MGNIWALVRRELHAYFASPIGYVALALFLFFYGFYFYGELEIFMDPKRASPGQVLNVNQDMIRWLLHTTAFIILFLLPLVTMRSFSEELRSGTIELLFTSPLTDLEIVLGKFFGALALYVIMLGSTLVHIGILFYFGDPEWKPLVRRSARRASVARPHLWQSRDATRSLLIRLAPVFRNSRCL